MKTAPSEDERIVRYTGRSKETAVIEGKPTPLGFKIWVVAQAGFFLRWLWHFKCSNYGAPTEGLRRKRGRPSTQERKAASEEEAALTLLDNTQGTYHAFVDNLFSTAPLFKKLRNHGYGATGTARPNCGIHKDLKRDKQLGKPGSYNYALNEASAIPAKDNLVNQIAWKDDALMLFLTTVFRGNERTNEERKKPSTDHLRARPIQAWFGDNLTKVVPIPTTATACNAEMNHVDRGDQLRSYTTDDPPLPRGGGGLAGSHWDLSS
ncbi:uncharacterized protein FRV6_16600 [Fusarium oxysporum]|uniref:PiggyBac transposable element-derived protein domain-containing protein n=1 Tax=Fusarium oxysporum TaxID=5507 RepID=A0A2H3TV31_FUSOX|nr:uncharacterized protein FRV6_16600 [Fusarium oxysporum]